MLNIESYNHDQGTNNWYEVPISNGPGFIFLQDTNPIVIGKTYLKRVISPEYISVSPSMKDISATHE